LAKTTVLTQRTGKNEKQSFETIIGTHTVQRDVRYSNTVKIEAAKFRAVFSKCDDHVVRGVFSSTTKYVKGVSVML